MATNIVDRTRGLMGRQGLGVGQGMLIRPCQSVHTFFMRFPIDVVFLDNENRVVRIVERMKPNRISPYVFRARSTLELPAGTVSVTSTHVGDKLTIS